ncbi:MAG: hypothetical protein WAT79_09885 [Saprospiraceae bacterium]
MIVNHHEAIGYITAQVSPHYIFKDGVVLDVYRWLFLKIGKDFAGRYRTGGVRISGANFISLNALKVNDHMAY